jgi:2-haloacid dehalogenase
LVDLGQQRKRGGIVAVENMPRAFVFDAYGTLFDVHSLLLKVGHDIRGDVPALSKLWRQKQLEYTWLLALMERYEDFWQVTERALRSAAAHCGIELTASQVKRLLNGYLSPAAFPDVKSALDAWKGSPLAILSNGTPAMLDAAVRANGFATYFDHVLSVDLLRTYKPSPRVYAMGPETLKLPAGEILFVSSNAWDAAGAKAYGYRVCWCNRTGAPSDDLGFTPDVVVRSLDEPTLREPLTH